MLAINLIYEEELKRNVQTELVMENLEEQADGYKLTFWHGNFMDSIGYESERKYNEIRKYLKKLINTTIEMPIIEFSNKLNAKST